MKVFQIVGNVCYWDASKQFPSLESTIGHFPPSVLFAEAPDYVFEGWGYDETAIGEERFLKPSAPEGFEYDEQTGTFYSKDSASNTAMKQLEKDIFLIVNEI